MANYSEKIANADWDNLTAGQKESMQALSNEVLKALESGNQNFLSIMENASRQTAGVLSNSRGYFQNIGGTYSASDSQNRVPAPCTDTKALDVATDHGRRPLATPLAVPVKEFEEISQLDADVKPVNTNQSLTNFAREAITEGGAPKLLEFVQAHNHVMQERDNQQTNPDPYQGFNGQDTGHGL